MADIPTKKDENEFAAVLRDMADRSKAEVEYNPTRFRQMLAAYGGFETAHRLLSKKEPSDGFTNMVLAGRIDLTMECLVQSPRWNRFFDPNELANAHSLTGGKC